MDAGDWGYDDDADEHSIFLEAFRKIGTEHARGIINPLAPSASAAPALGKDNLDLIHGGACTAKDAVDAQKRYEELKRQHQVNLNDAKQLADLEDAGLQEHIRQARQQLADQEQLRARLPDVATLRLEDSAARRALSGLMSSLNAQKMALQVASDDVLLQAANATKLAAGRQPHGYPLPDGQGSAVHAAKCYGTLGKKIMTAGENLEQISVALEAFERDLTLTRRSYEKVVDGLMQRILYYEAI